MIAAQQVTCPGFDNEFWVFGFFPKEGFLYFWTDSEFSYSLIAATNTTRIKYLKHNCNINLWAQALSH